MAATLIHELPVSRAVPRNIRKTILANGVLVLTESMPHVRSVAMGVWVNSGSRDEAAEINGISHFVEHMVFKGTNTRTAKQIAREVDTIGGNLDAFTSKETICFNMRVLDENVRPALEVLADLVLHPTFAEEDLAREQGVILEEIKMDEDNPDYLVHEIFTQRFWKDDALGRPILGTAETVSSFTRDTVLAYYNDRFSPRNLVFSAAGNLQHDVFVADVEAYFGSLAADRRVESIRHTAPATTPHITLRKKRSLEQVQMCLGVEAPRVSDERRYGVYLLNTILGGGMSSRLFQTVREDRGLAYSIYSEMNPFRDTGSICVYAGASVANTQQVLRLTLDEMTRLKREMVSESELKRAKDQLKSNIVIGLESSGSRMSNLARQQMYFHRFIDVEEITADIERVGVEDVQRLANDLFRTESIALTLLGNLKGMRVTREDLAC